LANAGTLRIKWPEDDSVVVKAIELANRAGEIGASADRIAKFNRLLRQNLPLNTGYGE
jgi:hypothetical protein